VRNETILNPGKALGHGEECLHQFFLAAHRDIDMAITHARANLRVRSRIHVVHRGPGFLAALKLGEATQGLAGRSLHDYVDRGLRGGDQSRRSPEHLDYFLASN
jgi:hypothetical protein